MCLASAVRAVVGLGPHDAFVTQDDACFVTWATAAVGWVGQLMHVEVVSMHKWHCTAARSADLPLLFLAFCAVTARSSFFLVSVCAVTARSSFFLVSVCFTVSSFF